MQSISPATAMSALSNFGRFGNRSVAKEDSFSMRQLGLMINESLDTECICRQVLAQLRSTREKLVTSVFLE